MKKIMMGRNKIISSKPKNLECGMEISDRGRKSKKEVVPEI